MNSFFKNMLMMMENYLENYFLCYDDEHDENGRPDNSVGIRREKVFNLNTFLRLRLVRLAHVLIVQFLFILDFLS